MQFSYFKRPDIISCVFITAIILSSFHAFSWFYMADAAAHIVLFAGLFYCLSQGVQLPHHLSGKLFIGLCFGMIAYQFAGLAFAPVTHAALKSVTLYSLFPLTALVLYASSSNILNRDLFFHMVANVGLALAVGAIVQDIFGWQELRNTSHFPFVNANSLATMIGVGWVIQWCRFLQNENSKRTYIFILSLIVLAVGLWTTGGRWAIICVIAISCFSYFFHKKPAIVIFKAFWVWGILTLILVVSGLLTLVALEDSLSASLNAVLRTFTVRLSMWESVIHALADGHALTGFGGNHYSFIYPYYKGALDNTTGNHAHNDIMHIAFEFGLIGLGIIAVIALLVGYKIIKMTKNRKGIDVKPIAVLLFIVAVGQMTTVIMLIPVMIIAAICTTMIIKSDDIGYSVINQGHMFKSVVIILTILIVGLYSQKAIERHYSAQSLFALKEGDLEKFQIVNNKADQFGLYLNPTIAAQNLRYMIALYEAGALQDNFSQSEIFKEMDYYLEDMRARNPYLSDTYYYAGKVALLKKQYSEARINFKKALEIDPTHEKASQDILYINLIES